MSPRLRSSARCRKTSRGELPFKQLQASGEVLVARHDFVHRLFDVDMPVCHRSQEFGGALDVLVHVDLYLSHTLSDASDALLNRIGNLLLVYLQGLL